MRSHTHHHACTHAAPISPPRTCTPLASQRLAGVLPKPSTPNPSVDTSSVITPPPSPFAPRIRPPRPLADDDLPATSHSYSYFNKQAQREAVPSLPAEVLSDFEALHEFELSGQDHTAASQCALIGMEPPSYLP